MSDSTVLTGRLGGCTTGESHTMEAYLGSHVPRQTIDSIITDNRMKRTLVLIRHYKTGAQFQRQCPFQATDGQIIH